MRTFGLEEARRFVPFLLETFGRVRGWLEEARALAAKVESGKLAPHDAVDARTRIEYLADQARKELLRIEEAGIEIKAVDGLVDFRALLDGHTVFLCWKYPEETIGYWHELDAGFAGRQPITDERAFAPTWVS